MADIWGFPEVNCKQAYKAKTLFWGGHKSDCITIPFQSYISRLFPDSSLYFIADAGHWVHADQAKAVLETFQGFLR